MTPIGSVPPPTFQTISPHSPLGKPAVGLESAIEKDSPLPPVEESAEAEELRHRDVLAKSRDDSDSNGGGKQSASEEGSEENADAQQSDRELALETQLTLAAQTAPAVIPAPLMAIYQARRLGEFETPAPPPGSLLDQQV